MSGNFRQKTCFSEALNKMQLCIICNCAEQLSTNQTLWSGIPLTCPYPPFYFSCLLGVWSCKHVSHTDKHVKRSREANSVVHMWSIWLPYYYLFCASACTTSDWQSMSFPGCSPCAETSAYTRSTCPGKHKNLNFTIRQVRGRLTKQNKMPRTRIQPLLTISLPNRRVITVTD